MNKHIVIIGGGISGCALLHYLKKKYAGKPHVQIDLLEKNDYLGGTIRSLTKDGCLFETGPNGFLDSKPRTLDFIKEMDLEGSLVKARQESSIRYLSVNQTLHQFPSSPKQFLSFKLLKLSQKLRVLGEFFIPKRDDPAESVYDFGKRRLGERFAQIFLDPMVSGIYGGDAHSTNLKAVFPKIHAMEQEHGSLIKAMIKMRKTQKSKTNGTPAGTLTSFKEGVAQMIHAVGEKYQKSIHLNCEVKSVSFTNDQFDIRTNESGQQFADELYICAPAYAISSMLNGYNHRLSQALNDIPYAPMAVVGLVYPSQYFKDKPKGYGYLIPSLENNEVLGVLFEGNIFPGRCRDDQVLFRVMIGGARHPDILKKSRQDLVAMASREIETIFKREQNSKTTIKPKELFFMPWAKAIPQYTKAYCEQMKTIDQELQNNQQLHLVANYIKGVSLNDCIENAYQSAQQSVLST